MVSPDAASGPSVKRELSLEALTKEALVLVNSPRNVRAVKEAEVSEYMRDAQLLKLRVSQLQKQCVAGPMQEVLLVIDLESAICKIADHLVALERELPPSDTHALPDFLDNREVFGPAAHDVRAIWKKIELLLNNTQG